MGFFERRGSAREAAHCSFRWCRYNAAHSKCDVWASQLELVGEKGDEEAANTLEGISLRRADGCVSGRRLRPWRLLRGGETDGTTTAATTTTRRRQRWRHSAESGAGPRPDSKWSLGGPGPPDFGTCVALPPASNRSPPRPIETSQTWIVAEPFKPTSLRLLASKTCSSSSGASLGTCVCRTGSHYAVPEPAGCSHLASVARSQPSWSDVDARASGEASPFPFHCLGSSALLTSSCLSPCPVMVFTRWRAEISCGN